MVRRSVSLSLRVVAPVILALSLVIVCAPAAFAANSTAQGRVGPKAYYLALGDSLGFGYQPNFDYSHGYADDFYHDLQGHGVTHYINMACSGENTASMIAGGCPTALVIPRKYFYLGPQLQTAVDFLKNHRGQVSPVTMDIGVNEFLESFAINGFNCNVDTDKAQNVLALMDYNLTQIILPALTRAMSVNGQMTGDLFMLNYYDPFANMCPNLAPWLQLLNQHLAADASGFATMVDVFTPFGGSTDPNPLVCTYTWMCNDPLFATGIHANTTGYQVMANAIEQTSGY
jgi:lysophospholipase L1-like esterase